MNTAKRGEVEVGIQEVMFLFLLILAGLFLAGFQAGGLNFIEQIKSQFCEGIGYVWCHASGESTTLGEERVALANFNALSCAVNAVAKGDKNACSGQKAPVENIVSYTNGEFFKQCKKGNWIANELYKSPKDFCEATCKTFTGCEKVLESSCKTELRSNYYCTFKMTDVVVECEDGKSGVTIVTPGIVRGKDQIDAQLKEANSKCGEVLKGSVAKPSKDPGTYDCYTVSCTVKNFVLPQKVTSAEEWIPGWGDPKYVAYWRSYPLEEDTWSYVANWKLYGQILAAEGYVTTRIVASTLIRTAKAAKGAATLAKAIRGGATKLIMGGLAKFAIGTTVITGVTLAAGMVTAELAEKQLGTVLEKFIPKENTLVLKTAGGVPHEKSVINSLPVLMEWSADEKTIKNFHLASPCYANSIDVKRQAVTCSLFSRNTETGAVVCVNEKYEQQKDAPSCSGSTPDIINQNTFSTTIGDTKISQFVEIFKGKKDRTFYYNSEGKVEKINILAYEDRHIDLIFDGGLDLQLTNDNIIVESGSSIETPVAFKFELRSAGNPKSEEHKGTLYCRTFDPTNGLFFKNALLEEAGEEYASVITNSESDMPVSCRIANAVDGEREPAYDLMQPFFGIEFIGSRKTNKLRILSYNDRSLSGFRTIYLKDVEGINEDGYIDYVKVRQTLIPPDGKSLSDVPLPDYYETSTDGKEMETTLPCNVDAVLVNKITKNEGVGSNYCYRVSSTVAKYGVQGLRLLSWGLILLPVTRIVPLGPTTNAVIRVFLEHQGKILLASITAETAADFLDKQTGKWPSSG